MTGILEATRKALGKTAPAEFETDPSSCKAFGCPCRGTVDIGNTGRFVCAWHAWADGERWPDITQQLQAHQWLIDQIGESQRLYTAASTGQPWLAQADEFWRTDEVMKPTGIERKRWPLYLWRLREELGFRVGVRAESPSVRVPESEEHRAKLAADPRFAGWAAGAPK